MERFGAAVVQEGSGLDRMELPREPHTRGAGAAGRAEGGAARRSHYGFLRGDSHQDSVTAAPATGGAAVCAQQPTAEDRMELPREPRTRGAGAAGRAEGGAARRSHYGLLRGTSHQDSVTAAPATGGAAVVRNCQRPGYTKTAILAHAQHSLHGITEHAYQVAALPHGRWQRQ